MAVPFLVGHRGYSDKYPENTLISLEAALDSGARYIEFDLQMTDDEVFVLLHDDNLKRVCGVDRSVFNLTSRTIRNFEANEYERFKYKYEGVHLARLDQAVSLLHEYPDAIAFVEIKSESLRHFGVEKIVPLLMEQLQPIKDRCYIISFDIEALKFIRQYSDYSLGYVLPKFNEHYRGYAEDLKPELLVCNYMKLPEFTEDNADDVLWPGDWEWMLYLINDAKLAMHYANIGVKYIETNVVGKLLQNTLMSENYFEHEKNENFDF